MSHSFVPPALASLVPPAPPRRERPYMVVDLARCASALARRPTGAPRSVTSQNPTSTLLYPLHTYTYNYSKLRAYGKSARSTARDPQAEQGSRRRTQGRTRAARATWVEEEGQRRALCCRRGGLPAGFAVSPSTVPARLGLRVCRRSCRVTAHVDTLTRCSATSSRGRRLPGGELVNDASPGW